LNMHPPNSPPDTPDTPTGETNVKAGQWYNYTTKTNDTDTGDKIRFQWKWTSNGIPGLWSIHKYDSGEYHTKSHAWVSSGEKEIRVRAKNPRSTNVFSNWSDPLSVTAEKSCYFEIVTTHSYQNNINNPNIHNSFNPNMVVVGQDVMYQGYSYDLGESPTYDYNFNGEQTRSSTQNPIYNFSETGMKYVNLTVRSNGESVYYNATIVVVNISACFNMSQLGAQPNQTIYFNDTTISKKTINSWFWDFGDGNTSVDQNTSHSFSNPGVYNVSLNITDIDDETSCFWEIVYVETNPPEIIDFICTPIPGTLGCNISLFAEVYDNSECGVNKVNFSVIYPSGALGEFTMYQSNDSMYDYEFVFNDTWQVGWYYYTIWVTDYANNINNFTGCGFQVAPAFGYSNIGNNSQNIADRITGSNFTVLVNGTADSVSAFIQTNTLTEVKCMIYRTSDNMLMGTTEEKIINTGEEPDWVTFNFTSIKPSLATGVDYVLVCWSNNTCNLYYDDNSGVYSGKYKIYSYGTSPSPSITWDGIDSYLYSIFCSYTTVPLIKSVSVSPGVVGFGFNTMITTVVERYFVPVEEVTVNITYPDNTIVNVSMTEVDSDTFRYVFDDAWSVGKYNFYVWFVDKLGGSCSSVTGNSSYTVNSFNVSSLATVSVCTEKDSYDGDDIINLTDPPDSGSSTGIGYELLDGGKVLHIWNNYDDYYFNSSNGLQFTNHFNKYWSCNVLMLGYYNNDQWNLVYRVDELSGFNKNIVSDNTSFVNVTLWKDLNYQGYSFRLAIRYFLGVDDRELTVIPYIKNLGINIPYVLGFAWEIKDIQVDMTPSGDYIEINGTSFYLNQSLDETYTDLDLPQFYIKEDFINNMSESLYLRWNGSLNYKLKVKSRSGQYNAPVTLGIKIGSLGVGQEKYTSLFWHDACEKSYFFNDYDTSDPCENWLTNPGYMVDGNDGTFASTNVNGDVELLDGNSCKDEDLGVISKVEVRCRGYYSGGFGANKKIILQPVFSGGDGGNHEFNTGSSAGWSNWFDVTVDTNAPEKWDWNHVIELCCDVVSNLSGGLILYCSKVEIRVTYNVNVFSDPIPVSGSMGVGLVPLLSISVDAVEEPMDISWLINCSGSWQVFGVNDSVSSGTYSQVFSNATINGFWWYWKVNVSFDTGYEESDVFSFFTGYESKIVNTGSTSFSGYLLMQVQFNDSGEWVLDSEVVNEISMRTIVVGGQLGLDEIFNEEKVNTGSFSHGSGLYRVYAAFRDPNGNVLVCDDESLLEASYEFTVTFE
ncbi:MAG: PKD domain-containing protein, partial [Candidatus Thermoplasmatota archaeon]|nr:PKD domain-containing protein [Candidatus Thermoplasmatota archaeon]